MNRRRNVEFTILKVIVNNNDGVRVQCNIYDENISIFLPQLKLNQVKLFYMFK